MTRSENMEHVEVLRHMKETIKAIMPSEVAALDAAIASLSAPQYPADAHCATCDCVPGMTPAIRFDATPAERDGVVRDHLIRMGWTPPAEAQAVAWAIVGINTGALLNVCHGSTEKMLADAEYWPELGFCVRPLVYGATAPPSAPVGVPVDVVREYLDARACYDAATRPPNSHARAPVLKHDDPDARRLREARVALDNAIYLAQQPAAVDGDNPYPAPRNRQEAAALARLALAYLGVTSAHIDAAVARCETDLAGQQGGSDNDR